VSELEKLPDRLTALESQIVQLRSEMRNEFSAVREEIRAGDTVLTAKIDETRREMHELNDETRRHMLVLHEEVIGRLAIIQEGQPRRRRRKET
jgi:predicted  nucleic acid-binding Zn-ribbon protein